MTNYTDRYLLAATRSVPESGRAELEAELRASIEDAIEARTANGEPPEAAERAVLTGLGDPERLAAGYVDRPLHLIGPEYYLDWWRLLKLLLLIVLPIAAAGIALGRVLSGANVGEVIASIVTSILTVGVHLGFWTTLVFVIVERTGTRRSRDGWSLDALPEPRPKGLGLADVVASLIFAVVMIAAVCWDRFAGFVQQGGVGLPVLEPTRWPLWLGILLVLTVAGLALGIVLYRRGRWTPALAAVNALLAVVAGVVGVVLLTTGSLLNPAFFQAVAPDRAASAQQTTTTIGVVIMIVIAVWSAADGVIKTVRQDRDRTAVDH
ncbi:permease prefix domain 1-containing protein [Microlunatus speluncae]|uniref:permease prefix domain 1-containing protein n=1 Tax=Microlunatus speluncae TaxID=2594267 RepID=UPI001266240F|nr:permease prefix domain 1-containing protein [Microlunatus speluncae]